MGHPQDNVEPTVHVCGGKLIDYAIRIHRGSKNIDHTERVSVERMREILILVKQGKRTVVRAALPEVGPLLDEGGLTSLMVALGYFSMPAG